MVCITSAYFFVGDFFTVTLTISNFSFDNSFKFTKLNFRVGFVIGPMLMSLGGLGWRYFPDDADFAPLERQAVIIGDKVVLHSDAARTSPEVIDAPPGSLAEVFQRSGRWAYVGFATKTRGWVPVESIEMIVPKDTPDPPKVRKTAADGSSA